MLGATPLGPRDEKDAIACASCVTASPPMIWGHGILACGGDVVLDHEAVGVVGNLRASSALFVTCDGASEALYRIVPAPPGCIHRLAATW